MKLPKTLLLGTVTSLLAAALIGYLGIIGVLPVVRTVMEDLPVTQSLLDHVQSYRVQPMTADKFNVMVADLEGDDTIGSSTKHVVRSLEAQFETSTANSPIGVQRAHRILALPNAPDRSIALQKAKAKGREQLNKFKADLLIWGEVVKSPDNRPILSLQFLNRESRQETKKESYTLGEKLDLPLEFSEDLGAALAAEVVADMFATIGKLERAKEAAPPLLKKLRALRSRMPAALAPEHKALIHASYAGVLHSIGGTKQDTPLLREAVNVYRDALSILRNFPENPQRMWLYINLGGAESWLGRLEDSVTRLRDSISSLTRASELATRSRTWSELPRIDFLLGNAYRDLYWKQQEPALLDNAIASFRRSLDHGRTDQNRITWAGRQGSLSGALMMKGQKSGSEDLIQEGIQGLQDAAKVLELENKPERWARAQNDIGWGFVQLSELRRNAEEAKTAIKHFDAALEVFDDTRPYFKTSVLISRAHSLRVLGTHEKNIAHLETAEKAFRDILRNIPVKAAADLEVRTQKELISVLLARGRLDSDARQDLFLEASELAKHLYNYAMSRDIQDVQQRGLRTAYALNYVARCALYLKDYARAANAAQQAMSIAPDKPYIRLVHAHSLVAADRLDEAKEIYLSLASDPESGTKMRRAILLDIERFDEAGVGISAFEQIKAALPAP
ncbi:MAG: hypothetical protein RIC14_13770 [Filomicrobium sp.]